MLRTSPIPREHNFQSLASDAIPAPSFPLAAPSISAGMWPTCHTRQPGVPACPPSVRCGRAKEIYSNSPEPVDPPHYQGVVFASRVKQAPVEGRLQRRVTARNSGLCKRRLCGFELRPETQRDWDRSGSADPLDPAPEHYCGAVPRGSGRRCCSTRAPASQGGRTDLPCLASVAAPFPPVSRIQNEPLIGLDIDPRAKSATAGGHEHVFALLVDNG